ncbi:hypothetical protein JT362_33345 [Actinophytocola sp. S1-96]|uniref:RNA polymerase sigma-70 region 2 domain-containing protein n=1 Tax=Actinophytocola gossypii TaxID=2812003 RepID=A0ABT2JJF2_9PSEU|nr:hypothetical protein [Actinophytocola gossypii]
MDEDETAWRTSGRDPDAFEDFYRAHLDTVQRFVARRVADPHLVADLTAEVFLAVVRSAHGYRADRAASRAGCTGSRTTWCPPSGARRAREHRAHERIAGRRELTGLSPHRRTLRGRRRAGARAGGPRRGGRGRLRPTGTVVPGHATALRVRAERAPDELGARPRWRLFVDRAAGGPP